jgi:hypothetical protein
MELTQAQRILFNSINKAANTLNEESISEENFIDIISDKEHPSHIFAMAQLEAMEVYGEAKWNEACDTVRENVSGNILIENDFLSLYLNPEFKP